MSEIIEGTEDFIEGAAESASDAVGLTSDELNESNEKKSLLESFTVFDAMLLMALLFVTLATLFLFFELRTFGNFPFEFPWRTDEYLSK
ncbi:MAG: hypothetical protein AB8B55_10680 [Mariniblastus sp.]